MLWIADLGDEPVNAIPAKNRRQLCLFLGSWKITCPFRIMEQLIGKKPDRTDTLIDITMSE